MQAQLDGQVSLVTGGGSGIGFAIAEGLCQRGASVVVADITGADVAAAELRECGYAAHGIDGDVTSESDVDRMVDTAVAEFGGLDILVNNAGIYASLTPQPFDALQISDWRRIFEVNVFGMFACCRSASRAMKSRGGGRIVNISSGVAFKGNPYMVHYVASKGAVISLTRALATEMGEYAILVNSIAPGFTLSENVLRNTTLVEGVKGPSLRNRVLARDMVPDDLVGAACFFAGPDSAFITGQTLVVDGGAYFH